MLLLFLSVLASAASPALHELLHADAKDAQHHCVVTSFAHGQVDAPAGGGSAPLPTPCFETVFPVTAWFASPTIEQFPLERAPPLLG